MMFCLCLTFQITSLALQGQELYIGTTWGCVVVVEASSLRPITVFRPYEDEVRLILPLTEGDRSPLIATIGKGYRNLLRRYGSWSNLAKCTSSTNVPEREQNMQVCSSLLRVNSLMGDAIH